MKFTIIFITCVLSCYCLFTYNKTKHTSANPKASIEGIVSDTIPNTNNRLKPKVHETICGTKNNMVIVKSNIINDYISDYHIEVGKPSILSQSLCYFIQGQLVREDTLAFFNKKIVSLISGTDTKQLEGVIMAVKTIHIKDDIIYSFYGGGQDNDMAEFFGLADIKGNWLWYYFGTKKDTFVEFGNYNLVLQKYGDEINDISNIKSIY